MTRPNRTEADAESNPYRPPGTETGRRIPWDPEREPVVIPLASRWLYRRLRFEAPLQMELEYDAFGLFDEIRIDGRRALRKLPLVRLTERFDLTLATDRGDVRLAIRLKFDRFARLRSLRIFCDDREIYREGPPAGAAEASQHSSRHAEKS